MKKTTISIAFLLSASFCFSQDTIQARKVKVCNQLINRKTGMVEKNFFRWIKVRSGYVIKEPDGTWLINDKIMKPNSNFVPLTAIKN